MKNNPYSPFNKYQSNEVNYVLDALNSESPLPSGKSWTQQFEEKFCAILGVNYAIACNSGTSGLHASVFAANIGPGDEVIIPALTVVMDAYAILHVGGIPVFAEVDQDTFNISPKDIEKKITPKTKAIIAVSLQGLPVDIDAIMSIAKKHNLIVIEDSCQTVLGQYKGRISGTDAHLTVWSFENKKHLTCGSEGGMITTNDKTFAERARKFAGIGYKHMTAQAGRTSLAMAEVQNPDYKRFDTLGLNYRMTEVSAAIGLGQLERIHDILSKRKQNAQFFQDAVKDCSWIIPQACPEGYENTYYTFAIKYFGFEEKGISWKEFYNRYIEMGGDGFYSACQCPYLEPVLEGMVLGNQHFQKGLCPNSEGLQRRLMQFKTNYRNIDEAKHKASILASLIQQINNGH